MHYSPLHLVLQYYTTSYTYHTKTTVSWEYLPDKIHVVDLGQNLGKYVVTNNLNQAIYIFSRLQLKDLEERWALYPFFILSF